MGDGHEEGEEWAQWMHTGRVHRGRAVVKCKTGKITHRNLQLQQQAAAPKVKEKAIAKEKREKELREAEAKRKAEQAKVCVVSFSVLTPR